ncbi:unnamed protein product [Rhizophagus irregularis]|uniref:Uncharacterized protein n=1 Tax=Rhizophagus irregularis TaxID=588596 RepID=A0A915YTR7_9GLOM|nr:unnamed protein product [Rhizophagus irregularis]CAB5332209.1 unnamed protein product [Rhizophagus irregularis]
MLDFFIFLTEGGIILWVTVSSRPFDKTKKFKETAEESKKCIYIDRVGFVYVMERKDVVDEDRLELYKNDLTNLMFHQNNCIRLEILEDDEYYDIGTSSIIDLSSEFKGGMYSWFEKDWGNLKKRYHRRDV